MKDKKLRRIKGAKALYEKNDPKIVKYKRNELFDILQNSKVHSPERSEPDEETDSSEKCKIFVYDRSWRSKELKTLLRDVLDPCSFSLQAAQLTRLRIYADKEQQLDVQPPNEMPDWACVGQEKDVLYDTDVSTYESLYELYDEYLHSSDEEERGESSAIGMIRGALKAADEAAKEKETSTKGKERQKVR
ncbi:unnamed protein product [Rhizophagus irregularis]|nr:unnamed protein product [Rhizophagus irregularis]